jgi:hypothetical protein
VDDDDGWRETMGGEAAKENLFSTLSIMIFIVFIIIIITSIHSSYLSHGCIKIKEKP